MMSVYFRDLLIFAVEAAADLKMELQVHVEVISNIF